MQQQFTNDRGYEFEREQGECIREALEETRERENYVKDIIISKIKEKCGVMRKK